MPKLATVPADEIEARPPPSPEKLARVRKLAGELYLAKKVRAGLASALAEADAGIKVIEERELPDAMRDIGARVLPLKDGWEVKLERTIGASISEARGADAHAWLRAVGAGSIVKTVVSVAFGKGEGKLAKRFLASLARRKVPLDVAVAEHVHAKTLRGFVRDWLDSERRGEVRPEYKMPRELFGVYEATRVELIGPPDKAKGNK